ncbi:hypothetical protein BH10PLA2_BH10PLA2_26350 [soil metagenome]
MQRWQLLVGLMFLLGGAASGAQAQVIDLTGAAVVAPSGLNRQEIYAATMLVDEVAARTRIRLPLLRNWPAPGDGPIIAVGPASVLEKLGAEGIAEPAIPPEGYRIRSGANKGRQVIWVTGSDSRGVLFGVGGLLRTLTMTRDKIQAHANLKVDSAPQQPIRGHQLGYRPKTNSYDAWSLPMWEQYFRDLAVFGCNAVELIPPRSDDADDSPHFPQPPLDMMIGMSRVLDNYGLDVWIWYPAMDKDYSNPATVELALKEWASVFEKLPRIDAIFVPGGDPGHTQPKYMFALLEKQTANLHKFHPKAQMWMSPQSFDQKWMEEFFELIKQEPTWLSGIVYGPQVRIPLAELREKLPKRYPIRNYPDITHSQRCEYPVPNWDLALASTLGRESINPRPQDQRYIFQNTFKQTIGFISYSEGCNDDVNKTLWSALGWNPNANMDSVLREYSRYFIGPEYEADFALGLANLERNWQGPALNNAGIQTTLAQFQAMERRATPRDRQNWRFQQALYRAYFDAYVQRRLLNETDLEAKARDRLRMAPELGAVPAMAAAEEILERAITAPPAPELRLRVFSLAEALFQSIRMQLSVERYQAIDIGRGANLDLIDVPLNDRRWLKSRFQAIRKLEPEEARLREIHTILHWTDPGPGGYYDDLGNATRQPHLITGLGFAKDPRYWNTPQMLPGNHRTYRRSWWDTAMALYDAPLKMHYGDLDPNATYRLRVVYGGEGFLELKANDRQQIHGLIKRPYEVMEFDIPSAATGSGKLDMAWKSALGAGGPGRGCQVAEVWLIKKK